MKLPKSIEAYPEHCAAILSWMPTDQDTFDKKVSKFHETRMYNFTDETIVLPSHVGNQQGKWGDFLTILHVMQSEGIIKASVRKDGKIEYKCA